MVMWRIFPDRFWGLRDDMTTVDDMNEARVGVSDAVT